VVWADGDVDNDGIFLPGSPDGVSLTAPVDGIGTR
jgi:hypothetical protein